MALAARDAGEWSEMREKAKGISAAELMAVLYLNAAEAADGKDRIASAELLTEVLKHAEKIQELEVRAGVLLGVAAVHVRSDVFAGLEVLKTAVKTVNQNPPKDQSAFSFLMKVSLACPGHDEWYGTRISLRNATLYEVFPIFSEYNVEETLLIARSLEDASTKIRAVASVVKHVTDEKIFKPKTKLPVTNLAEQEKRP
jgi:hypothetical protein